jgi:hypothetical protein
MKHDGTVGVALAAIIVSLSATPQQSVTLNVVTAGDQNMVRLRQGLSGANVRE